MTTDLILDVAYGTPTGYRPIAGQPDKVTCVRCGKTISREKAIAEGIGHTCSVNAELIASGKSLGQLTAQMPPKGYVKLQAVTDAIKTLRKDKKAPCTVGGMVKATGGDGGHLTPAHPSLRPVYVGGVRYLPEWYTTLAGLTAIGTKNFKGAPKPYNPKD